jgi:hypothetical protein
MTKVHRKLVVKRRRKPPAEDRQPPKQFLEGVKSHLRRFGPTKGRLTNDC